MRPGVERMCHCLKTMQRLVVSHVNSIYQNKHQHRVPGLVVELRRPAIKRAVRGRDTHAHAAHVVHAIAAAVAHVAGVVHLRVVHGWHQSRLANVICEAVVFVTFGLKMERRKVARRER